MPNPSVKAWAESNPELAAQERARLGAYTDEEIEERGNKTKTNSLGKMNPTYARDNNIKEQTTPATMTNRLGRLDPGSGASVNPKTHKLCLEARDYLGCVKAMDGYVPPSKSYSRNEIESPFNQTKTLPSNKKKVKTIGCDGSFAAPRCFSNN